MLETSSLRWFERLVTNLPHRRAYIFSFVLGFTVRLIPELLSYPNPIGFDTLYYAARVKSGVVWSGWTSVFSMWLFEGIIIAVNRILQLDPFLPLKLAALLLYGLNVSGIYNFSRKALNWGTKTALIAAFFFAFQLASLRLSWDLQRNMLGSAVLLFALPLLKSVETKRSFVMLLALSLVLVISHTLVSIMLFAVILGRVVDQWLKNEKIKSLMLLLAVLPSFTVLFVSLFVFPPVPYVVENVLVSEIVAQQSPKGLSFLVNYMGVPAAFHTYSTYLDLASHVLSVFSILHFWWLPLVLVGLFRDQILDCWTLVLLVGSFNVLITPFFAVDWWNRWMLMLVYPFTFYAINGAEKVFKFGSRSGIPICRWLSWIKITRRTVIGVFFLTISLGSIFMTVPPFFDRFGVFCIPTTISYIPSTMLYNSVPLRDVQPTIEAFEWLNKRMNDSSSVIVHDAFLWWANLYLDDGKVMIYFNKDINKALNTALEHGFSLVYLVWWNENYFSWQDETVGWYGVTLPTYFTTAFRDDRITVYRYSTSFVGGST